MARDASSPPSFVLAIAPLHSGWAGVALGLTVLLGWSADWAILKSAAPGLVPMAPSTALGFILLGAALLLRAPRWQGTREPLAIACALGAAALGLAALAEKGLGRPLLPDTLILASRPDGVRMAASTAVNFLLLGLGAALLELETASGWRPAQLLAAGAWVSATGALAAHVYAVGSLFDPPGPPPVVALHTALGFLALSLGLLWARPCRCFLNVAIEPGPAGQLARRSVLIALVLPMLLDILAALASRAGLIPLGQVSAAHATVLMISFTGIGLALATSLKRAEQVQSDAERRLADTEGRYRALFEQSPDGVIILEPSTLRILEANAAACRPLGYSREEFRQLDLPRIEDPGTLASTRSALEAAEREGQALFEARHVGRDGSRREMLVSARPVALDGRAVLHATVRDVTQLRRDEERHRVLTRVVEQSANIVIVTDPDGRIEYVNPKFTEVTGYASEEVLGKNPRFLKSGDSPPEMYRAFWEKLLSGNSWRGEIRNKRKDGTFYWAAGSASPIRDDSGRIAHLVAVQEDITERKGIEAQLLQAQKLESLGRLAGAVAHDFNNILTAIVGCAELSLAAVPEGSSAKADLREIILSSRRATELTRQLLAFSKRQIGRKVEVDVNERLLSLHHLLRRLLGADIELSLTPSAETLTALIDPGHLEQVIVNLAVNARDAMAGGGVLRIATRKAAPPEADGPGGSGALACIEVSDTGTGMTPGTMSRIFEPFFTTKEPGRGTGLGLSTCFGIVKQAGGHIAVRSEVGRGSTFEVQLPLVENPQEAHREQAPPEEERGGAESILLVDDEASLRAMAARVLKQKGYRVTEASNGEEALRLLRGLGQVDLLLTDLVMPQLSGGELAKEARRLRPGLRALFMSGYVDESSLRRNDLDPTSNFLEKPFTPGALIRRVRMLLDNAPSPGA